MSFLLFSSSRDARLRWDRRALAWVGQLALLWGVASATARAAAAWELASPDGRIGVQVDLVSAEGGTQLVYRASFAGRPVVAQSSIAYVRDDGQVIGRQLSLLAETRAESRQTWVPIYGERSLVEDSYRELQLNLHDSAAACGMRVTFRCYDAGLAFKAELSADASQPTLKLREELGEFRFHHDHPAWRTTAAQGEYSQTPLSLLGSEVERPLVVEVDQHVYAAIAEARLVDYARMKLQSLGEPGFGVVSQLSSGIVASGPTLVTPWRVILLGETPGSLLENNALLLNLNDPCAIADTSWIRPGKVLRDVTLTNRGARACIDFAAGNGIQYVEFDAGWYGHEYDDAADATTITPDPRRSTDVLELPELIDYASKQGVGIILYVNRRALERQLDEILPLYREWGVAGIKYGFVNVGSQQWTTWLHEAVRKAAHYQLMVDVHDEYRPTGYSRTYPNLMTQEGVRGDEATPSAAQAITTLFTRGLSGASDHTICYFDPRVAKNWTHGHQLGKAICSYSPWQFLYWYDTPLSGGRDGKGANEIVAVPELEFFAQLPTTWDETRVLHGRIGEFAVIARRSGREWFVGAMNNSEPRVLETPLDFLDPGINYEAILFCDDPAAESPTKIRMDRKPANSTLSLPLELRANGGQAVRLTPSSGKDTAGG